MDSNCCILRTNQIGAATAGKKSGIVHGNDRKSAHRVIGTDPTPEQKMNVSYTVLWAIVIVLLIILNMGLCYWIGFVSGKRKSKRRRIVVAGRIPVQKQAVVPAVSTIVTVPPVCAIAPQPTPIPEPEQAHVVVTPQTLGAAGRSHHTLVGITCEPRGQGWNPAPTVLSLSPDSYDSDVFTESPYSPTSEDEAAAKASHFFHNKRNRHRF